MDVQRLEVYPVSAMRRNSDDSDRKLVNSVQACRIVGIARSTLYLWIRLGKVEVTRTAGGQLRIFADTLFQRDPRGRKPRDL